MVVLGINSVYHETAAAIVADGVLIAAVEEERFNRRKHGKQALVGNPHDIPVQSIQYCLRKAGVSPSDINAIGYSFDPKLRLEKFILDERSIKGDWGDSEGETTFLESLRAV